MSRRSLAFVLAATLLIAACGARSTGNEPASTPRATEPTTTSPPSITEPEESLHDGVLITVIGPVLPGDRGTLEICPTAGDDCAGIPLAGEISPPESDPPVMRLTGRYDGARLTVTAAAVPDLSGLIDPDYTTPCEELRGQSAGNPSPDPEASVATYLETIPDRYAGRWWDSANGVMTIWLTGEDLDDHRAALEGAAGEEGRICVIGGAHYTEAQLLETQARLLEAIDIEATAPSGAGINTLMNRVELGVEYLDAATRDQIEQEFGDAVVFFPFIEVLEGSIADLPDPVVARPGNVELLTQSSRAGGGMDALGTYEVAFDTDQRCVFFPGGGDAAGGTGRTVAVWPFGYSAESDPLRIYDQDGRLVAREGDRIQMGGGSVGAPTQQHPANCDANDVWVISSRAEVIVP